MWYNEYRLVITLSTNEILVNNKNIELKQNALDDNQKLKFKVPQEKYEKLVMLPSMTYPRKEREEIRKKEAKILKLTRN